MEKENIDKSKDSDLKISVYKYRNFKGQNHSWHLVADYIGSRFSSLPLNILHMVQNFFTCYKKAHIWMISFFFFFSD